VAQQLVERDEFLVEIRDHLEQAQQHYKSYYDKKHRDLQFSVREWVWLRLLNRPVVSLDITGRGKLGPRFYGPFKIIERVGDVAYKLELLVGAKLHSVFHVGLLKPCHGTTLNGPGVLPPTRHGRAIPQPAEVIKGRLAHGVHELLVRWTGQATADTTWVELGTFKRDFPSFQLEDELVLQEGRDVMTEIPYQRRGQRQPNLPKASCAEKERNQELS
jgi:hypothetical protein